MRTSRFWLEKISVTKNFDMATFFKLGGGEDFFFATSTV